MGHLSHQTLGIDQERCANTHRARHDTKPGLDCDLGLLWNAWSFKRQNLTTTITSASFGKFKLYLESKDQSHIPSTAATGAWWNPSSCRKISVPWSSPDGLQAFSEGCSAFWCSQLGPPAKYPQRTQVEQTRSKGVQQSSENLDTPLLSLLSPKPSLLSFTHSPWAVHNPKLKPTLLALELKDLQVQLKSSSCTLTSWAAAGQDHHKEVPQQFSASLTRFRSLAW